MPAVMSEQLYRQVPGPYRMRKPHPDAFWSDKYGWMEPVSTNYEAAEDTYLGFIDETERSRLHTDDFDEARRQARVVVRAAIVGNEADRQGSGGDDEAGSIPSVKGWEPAVTPRRNRRHR